MIDRQMNGRGNKRKEERKEGRKEGRLVSYTKAISYTEQLLSKELHVFHMCLRCHHSPPCHHTPGHIFVNVGSVRKLVRITVNQKVKPDQPLGAY